MNLYYIYRRPKLENDAGYKYREDVLTILSDSGADIIYDDREMEASYIKRKTGTILFLFRCLRRLKRHSMVLTLFPASVTIHKVLRPLCVLKRSGLVGIIMDINSLRFLSTDRRKEFRQLGLFDSLIVQNRKQCDIIRESGYRKPISIQGILDFLGEPVVREENPEHHMICYGGALTREQSGFLLEWQKQHNLQHLQIMIYGPRLEFDVEDDHFHYCGESSPEEIIHQLSGSYGLVWNGTSIDSLGGIKGGYYRVASPHKLSMYIMAGLPVIVHKDSAMADFVTDQHIGLTVDSLEDLEERISEVSDEQYREFVENVRKVGKRISKGYYLRTSLHELVGG